ncbi:hypothetical protein H8356DRAFT_1297965 [Neocallimastix lanati (nom. inval.)]|nr:hypothetical protein H8356DRAFT_1297965 [Neocallimastix sp. JGI-2020a]
MSKYSEENTKDFYKELNGECNPEKLLNIAEQGIFLKEPLFKYEKKKNHKYVVDISVISNQFFSINNIEQYNRLKYFFKEDYIYGKYHQVNYFWGKYSPLIIINKYFIDKLLYEKDKEFLEKVVTKNIFGYRVPMNHCFEILKYYSDKLCVKNNLYLKCEDKYTEEFINICFAHCNLSDFKFFQNTFQKCFSIRYNIDFYKIAKNFEIIISIILLIV